MSREAIWLGMLLSIVTATLLFSERMLSCSCITFDRLDRCMGAFAANALRSEFVMIHTTACWGVAAAASDASIARGMAGSGAFHHFQLCYSEEFFSEKEH